MPSISLRLAALSNNVISNVASAVDLDSIADGAAQLLHLHLKIAADRHKSPELPSPFYLMRQHIRRLESVPALSEQRNRLQTCDDVINESCVDMLLAARTRRRALRLCRIFNLGRHGMKIWEEDRYKQQEEELLKQQQHQQQAKSQKKRKAKKGKGDGADAAPPTTPRRKKQKRSAAAAGGGGGYVARKRQSAQAELISSDAICDIDCSTRSRFSPDQSENNLVVVLAADDGDGAAAMVVTPSSSPIKYDVTTTSCATDGNDEEGLTTPFPQSALVWTQ